MSGVTSFHKHCSYFQSKGNRKEHSTAEKEDVDNLKSDEPHKLLKLMICRAIPVLNFTCFHSQVGSQPLYLILKT